MRFRRRSSVLPRAPWPNGLERTEPLRGQLWTRSERSVRPPDVHWAWRGLAAGAAIVEAALLAWLWFGPALAVRSVEVTGAHHLSAGQVAAAAGVSSHGSVISIDGQSAQGRLLDQVWVRTATVQPLLPGTVAIQVSEWEPVAAYHAGSSPKLFLLSSQAIILGPTPAGGGLVDIQGPAGTEPRVGERALDPQLLAALDSIFGAFKAYIAGTFEPRVFFSGLLTNMTLAGVLTYFGDKLGVDLSIAAIVAFGVRIFNNLGAIRRHYL